MDLEVGTPVLVAGETWFAGRKYTMLGFIVAFLPKGSAPSEIYPACDCLAYSQLNDVPVPDDRYLIEYRWGPERNAGSLSYSALRTDMFRVLTLEEASQRKDVLEYIKEI
jgi:hypothetical protein